MNVSTHSTVNHTTVSANGDAPARGLPGWAYHDAEFFQLEIDRVFRRSWQIVCHHSDVAAPGDYFTFHFVGEPLVVVRGDDGRLRAFYNVCRHRAARLLDDQGRCGERIRCPYHAWGYDLRGRLQNVPNQSGYRGFDKADWGLREVALQQWLGFVFVCLEPDEVPTPAESLAPVTEELRPYRFEQMRATGRVTLRPRQVNWKTVTDNYVDALHINVAHDGLRRIAGRGYRLEADAAADAAVQKITAPVEAAPGAGWSQRAYCALLERSEVGHLPAERRRLWSYYMIWPNIALDVYPDQIDFMQMLPISPTETLIREIPYALPGASRSLRAARYLNWRINRIVNAEDTELIGRVQQGMQSRSFSQGPLSDSETCLAGFAERLRRELPACRHAQRPAALR